MTTAYVTSASDRLLDVIDRLCGLLSQGKAAAQITARRDIEGKHWQWELLEKAEEAANILSQCNADFPK